MTTAITIIWAIAVLYSLKNTKWLLAITILALPTYQIRFALGNIPVTLLEISILILFAQWFFTQEKTRIKSLYEEYKNLFRFIAVLLIAASISIFTSPDTTAAAGIWKAYFLEPILFFTVFIDVVRTKKELRLVVNALAFVAAAIAIATVAQALNWLPTLEPWKTDHRYTGLFPYPNAVGLFLAPLIPIFVASSKCLCKRWDSILLMLTALISLLAIFMAQSEGAVVALTGSIIIWGLFRGRRFRFGSITAIITAIFIIQTQPLILDKLLLKDWSGTVRRLMWQDTVTMITHHPIAGAGLSGYPAAFAKYHKHPAIEIFQYPHNIILNTWSEIGLLGLIAFIAIIAYFGFILLTRPKTKHSYFQHALGVSMLILVIHGIVDVPYFKNDLSILFWIIVGMLIANPHIDTDTKKT
ncbi:MAG: hypothetical protein CMI52_03975 [Parcubacteria group bacterium]|nr:hypothetical protein [Parcubacteria group bacterium]